jgi:hypothetical protein
MTTQRDRALAIADATARAALTLFAIGDVFVAVHAPIALAILGGCARAVTLADLGIAADAGRLPLGLRVPFDQGQVADSVRTVLAYDDPEPRLDRLARSAPLEAWQRGRTEAMRAHRIDGWTRATGPNPCPACAGYADGARDGRRYHDVSLVAHAVSRTARLRSGGPSEAT